MMLPRLVLRRSSLGRSQAFHHIDHPDVAVRVDHQVA
jgi:hypothetical protein